MAIANITNNILTDSGIATSSLLPYTGATTNVDLGTNSISSSFIYGNGVSGLAGSIYLKQTTSIQDSSSGYSSMSAFGASSLHFSLNNGTLNRRFRINSVNLDGTNIRTYLLPDADGTIALTSDLSAYLPLTGGTLTGALSGTTATFSGLGTFYQLTMTGATAGRIFYAQTGGVVSQSGNLNWNETNGMLGVGTPNPSAVITAFSNNAATQFKAAGTAPAFTFSESLTTSTYACVFGLATSANHFITGTAAGDMAIANQSATAGAIVFGTGTAEKMRMSPSGRLLVGTSVDSGALFQVNGTTNLTGALSGTSASFSGALTSIQGNFNQTATSGFAITMKNRNANQQWNFVVDTDAVDDKNFGLYSTQAGVYALKIASTGAATFSSSVTMASGSAIIGANNGLKIGYDNAGGGMYFADGNNASTFKNWRIGTSLVVGGDLSFTPSTTNGGTTFSTPSMLITSSGNVGIGTSSPQTLLHLQKAQGSGSILLRMQNDSVDGYTGVHLYGSDSALKAHFGWANTSAGTLADKMYFGTIAAKDVVFTTNDAERMRITSGGNVGIGTTSVLSAYKITISGAGGSIAALASGAGDANFYSASTTIGYHFYGESGTAKFYVVNGGQIHSTSTSITAISDIRHKENIRPLETGLTEILQLKPSRFDWKEGKGTGKKDVAGFIAQDIEEILPDLVDEWKETMQSTEAFKSIRMGDLIPTLVKAIQEQNQIITNLEARIKQLENK